MDRWRGRPRPSRVRSERINRSTRHDSGRCHSGNRRRSAPRPQPLKREKASNGRSGLGLESFNLQWNLESECFASPEQDGERGPIEWTDAENTESAEAGNRIERGTGTGRDQPCRHSRDERESPRRAFSPIPGEAGGPGEDASSPRDRGTEGQPVRPERRPGSWRPCAALVPLARPGSPRADGPPSRRRSLRPGFSSAIAAVSAKFVRPSRPDGAWLIRPGGDPGSPLRGPIQPSRTAS